MSGMYDGPDGQRLHGDGKPVVSTAPDWLLERMEALRKLPPPTLEEVNASFRAVEQHRRNPGDVCKVCGMIWYNCLCSHDD